MTLAQEATNAINIPNFGNIIGCHAAVWFWAAREAQALGLTGAKDVIATMGNVAQMSPQRATAGLVPTGNWDFTITPGLPPAGTVLYWPDGVTHIAVVTAAGTIAGYNQVVQFPGLGDDRGHTLEPPGNLGADHRRVTLISEASIVRRAGAMGL